jgi:hypothetical protein
LKKHSKSCQRSEATLKRTKSRGPVQREAKEVMAEVLGKLTGRGALVCERQEKIAGRTRLAPIGIV